MVIHSDIVTRSSDSTPEMLKNILEDLDKVQMPLAGIEGRVSRSDPALYAQLAELSQILEDLFGQICEKVYGPQY